MKKIIKIGQYLPKLCSNEKWSRFYDSRCSSLAYVSKFGRHPFPRSSAILFYRMQTGSDPDFRINPYPHPDICRICPKMLWIKPKIRNRISDRFRLNVWRRRRFELSECSCLLLYTMVEIICCVMFLVVACRTQWDQRPAQGHD